MTAANLQREYRIGFCTTTDGVRVAYAAGGRGAPMIKTPNWLNHLELDVVSPVWRGWLAEMTQRFRLVRYDSRGCGLSDRLVPDVSLSAFGRDLEAVVAASGLKRFALYGASQGAAIAIEYAARHPERVSHLILCGSYVRGVLRRGADRLAIEEADLMLRLVKVGWGRANSAFRQVFATQFIPDSTPEQLGAFDDIQRLTTSAQTATRLLASFYEVDVALAAQQVKCPTLVLHARRDARVPFDAGIEVATAIPGAEFVPLDSRNHILLSHEPAWRVFFDEIDRFMQRHRDPQSRMPPSFAQLTPTERRVLELMASAFTNGGIAAQLGISGKTVRNHINHIFSKLDVTDRPHAIVLARDAGMGLSRE